MRPFGPAAALLGALVATLIAARAVKRKSLTTAGAAAAWIVGFLSICTGLRGFVLLMFYQLGTIATKYRKEVKESRDASAAKGAVRGPGQVFACSAIAVACSVVHALLYGEEKSIDFVENQGASSLACAVIAHHATCLADTLASELGILARQEPVLITQPWRRVPPGTNGGVTWWGTLWSGIGGILMGLGTALMDAASGIEIRPAAVLCYGLACGLVGSFIDSVLGATVQVSYYDNDKKLAYCGEDTMLPPSALRICGANVLSNAQVNLVSVLVTSVLGGLVMGPIFFGM
uniref:Transmembrane protein 19 n=1 Tax=Pseudictyota dubia TaxID=2749911 RepID=A0A7R9ZDG7_9STRA|mmetsp:Transcript_38966/g.71994  ORF Transcript_38966/g.71994 Transcript_38966/m.71994 type:complete len:290 (+) Transcript_38966:215-1084(+)|eukprot:CAMPEP_0197438050 /NCGR_PEP_ID=MMETSP1175-20131217/5149_1 /TAXON_ID=1003142 /ORGANISM="Triceratium dubium, Strain CCMP147" /LENGTH=289 /DNA_ID=CAMNT_0042967701 /DNA_START=211 /DNA_END=1080 /DNA_ORIENTATION=-